MKTKIRNPNPRNPKEVRNPKAEYDFHLSHGNGLPGPRLSTVASASDFGFLSDFGFRTSDLSQSVSKKRSLRREEADFSNLRYIRFPTSAATMILLIDSHDKN